MTSPLPAAYDWLNRKAGLSKMLQVAIADHGIVEAPGAKNNPVILAWAKAAGLGKVYTHDAIAWCGLSMTRWANLAGWEPVKDPLWARNWAKFGQDVDKAAAALGDVLVFSRPGGGGHVGLYVGEDQTHYHVLGGNTSDAVSIARLAKTRLLAVRRPKWRNSQPTGVVKVHLKATGKVSENEA